MWYIANEEIFSIAFNKKEESGMATILDDYHSYGFKHSHIVQLQTPTSLPLSLQSKKKSQTWGQLWNWKGYQVWGGLQGKKPS